MKKNDSFIVEELSFGSWESDSLIWPEPEEWSFSDFEFLNPKWEEPQEWGDIPEWTILQEWNSGESRRGREGGE